MVHHYTKLTADTLGEEELINGLHLDIHSGFESFPSKVISMSMQPFRWNTTIAILRDLIWLLMVPFAELGCCGNKDAQLATHYCDVNGIPTIPLAGTPWMSTRARWKQLPPSVTQICFKPSSSKSEKRMRRGNGPLCCFPFYRCLLRLATDNWEVC